MILTPSWSKDRRAHFRACMIGTALAAVFFIGVLLTSDVSFRSRSWTGTFYGAQARAFLQMRWDVPLSTLGIEGFLHNGRWFMYYGPFPALLRLPIELVYPRLSGFLTQSAMLLAWTTLMVAASDLGWRVRRVVRGEGVPVGTLERWASGVFIFGLGTGSVLIFLASQAWIYHEAELWGAALAIAAFDAILAYIMKPSRKILILASALATFSVTSRASVGLGPVAALGLLAIASLTLPTQRLFGLTREESSRWVRAGALAAACVIPIAIYAYTNWAKFGTFFVFPTDQQLMSKINPQRRDFLAESGGSYFGVQFIPTTLWSYLRPNGLGLRSLLPWITFPGTPSVIGGATFDTIEPTSSVTSSMPLLTFLSAIGFIGAWRRQREDWHLQTLRIPLLGAIICGVSVLPFGYIAQRYLTDFLPLLVLSGLIGIHVVLRWSTGSATSARRVRWTWRFLATVLVCSVLINLALAIDYHWTTPWAREDQLAEIIRAQYDLHANVPGGTAPYVKRGSHLPWPPSARGTTFVVGDCAGVYWSQGAIPSMAWSPWLAVGRTRATGEYRLRVRFDTTLQRTLEPLVVRGEEGQLQSLVAVVSGNRVQFGFVSQGNDDLPHGPRGPDGVFTSPGVSIDPRREYEIVAVMDPENGKVKVQLDGKLTLDFYQFELTPQQLDGYVFPTSRVSIGENPGRGPVAQKFLGDIREIQGKRPKICDLLVPRAKNPV